MDLRARVAMTEATPPELYEGQRALQQRLAVLKAAVALDGMRGQER
jgi:hypothetical protein